MAISGVRFVGCGFRSTATDELSMLDSGTEDMILFHAFE